ncbi:MAG: T9SS type A sorting domain-containing protein [Bacteroidetes bacterium]|nr:T9SS type A sorting domain-containing protein [Bacteroidota bacterium]
MKKSTLILLSLAFAGISLSAAGRTYEVINGNTHQWWPSSASGLFDYAIHFKNLTDAPIQLRYKKLSADVPSAWSSTFCDNKNCYFDNMYDMDTFAAFNKTDDVSIKISFDVKGKADTSIIRYEVYDINNPGIKDTIEWNVFVRWSASSTDLVQSGLLLGPNPAGGFLSAQMPGLREATISDLNGRILLHGKADESNQVRLNLEALKAGSYIFTGYSPQGVISRKVSHNP